MDRAEELKNRVLKAQKEGSIADLYVLESEAHEVFDEATIGGYYQNILDLALERLTATLEEHRRMDMKEVQDFATVRALYEYAMEHYSAGKGSDASALFEVLSGISDDKRFSDSLKFHWIASKEGMAMEDFLENIADIETTQKTKTFYISCFTKEAQNLLVHLK